MPCDFFRLINSRRSIREFTDENVDGESLRTILQAANTAPSAGDLQAFEVVVVRDIVRRRQLAYAAFGQLFLERAPLILVFFADHQRSLARYGDRGVQLYCVQDATIAACYAQLAAHALGLGSVWVGAFDDEAVAACVGATHNLVPAVILAIGHPAESPEGTSRRSLSDVARIEEINNPYTTD